MKSCNPRTTDIKKQGIFFRIKVEIMIDLISKTLCNNTGQKYIVVDQDTNNGYFYLQIGDEKKRYSYSFCFLNGLFKAEDNEIQTQIMQELNKPIQKPKADGLLFMHSYGTTAENIYNMCCKKYGFDNDYIWLFGRRQELYAMDATKEGYSVWFLAHSNWTESKGGKWSNEIKYGAKHITEYWDNIDDRFNNDKRTRLVFAKKQNQYLFLGIYKFVKNDWKTRTKEYEQISTSYPE